jgi:hypothetical protein
MERSEIIAARITFLRTMRETRQQATHKFYYIDETWIKQNHSKKSCWQMNAEVGRARVENGADLLYAMPDMLLLGAYLTANCYSVPNLRAKLIPIRE